MPVHRKTAGRVELAHDPRGTIATDAAGVLADCSARWLATTEAALYVPPRGRLARTADARHRPGVPTGAYRK